MSPHLVSLLPPSLLGVSGDGAWRGLRVRIGLHTGKCLGEIDPTTKRMDYFGNMVNYSARIEGQAEGGEIVMSDSTKQDCDQVGADLRLDGALAIHETINTDGDGRYVGDTTSNPHPSLALALSFDLVAPSLTLDHP